MRGKVNCYTDGSCPVNPGPGGWAYVIVLPEGRGEPIEDSGYAERATNNTMEVQAALECMKRLIAEGLYQTVSINVWSDSRYVVNGFQSWRHLWADDDFDSCQKNRVLWREGHKLAEKFRAIRFNWVKGHRGHYYNERCDHMAGAAVKHGNRKQYVSTGNRRTK